MLKRLELVGFKSFADKTPFDFNAGITGIVGPNGSGKSNIVDAVRWILGEQSAKSLRGGEMADVIFNGSTSRRSLGLAEVTMTFDNSRASLAIEAGEVQITRRVYRSGEGEYLINQQPSRLRDIKNLFLGTGAGSDAYCIIEQGRVDVLLQASTKERRTIFEEAAGISRFKAKKIEALRKLERVDQNLERLKDIIEEVEKQLRSVKLQASKAQRYQEYSQRLKELRVALGLEEYHQMTLRLKEETAVLARLRSALERRTAEMQSWEAQTRDLEEKVGELDEAAHRHEAGLAQAKQQIAAEESTLAHEWTLSNNLDADLAATRTRLTELTARVRTLAETALQAAGELQQVESQGNERRRQVDSLEAILRDAVSRLTDLQSQVQADHAEHLEQMRRAAALHNEVVSSKAHLDNLSRERERLTHKAEQASMHLASLQVEVRQLAEGAEGLQTRLVGARQSLAEIRVERERLTQLRDAATQSIADLRAERSGLASRIEVLDGLERSHEGLGTGVREVLALLIGDAGDDRNFRSLATENTEGSEEHHFSVPSVNSVAHLSQKTPKLDLSQNILGMVADFLTVRREFAPLIDLALGDKAQRFLVRDREQLDKSLGALKQPLSGRVSFFPWVTTNPASISTANHHDIIGHPGLVARADQVVTCDHLELSDLPRQLLGRTMIVQDLAAARILADQAPDCRFVTLHGEMLEADGTLIVGTHHAETGILSRKSELRELREQTAQLDHRIAEIENEFAGYRERLAALDSRSAKVQEDIQVLTEQEADLKSRLDSRRQRQEGLTEEVVLSRSEIESLEREFRTLDQAWRQSKTLADEADLRVHALQTRLEGAEREIRQSEQIRQDRQQEVTAAQVALAQVAERLAALQARQRQLEADLNQRRSEQTEGEVRLVTARNRLEESQRTMLLASAALAHWYLEKESAERQVAETNRERENKRLERHQLAERSQTARSEWQVQQEQAHARELVVNDMRHNRESLADRLREDYQIELAILYQESGIRNQEKREGEAPAEPRMEMARQEPRHPEAHPLDPLVVNEEIAELRRKLARLGSVNLDSLQELSELEGRATHLQTQSQDLTSAKKSLEEIINTINQDSRRLFTETFEAVRLHFQELFRKLFGGGMADILLEDGTDILESGIEIIARPPGKELRSISLMSGGEKTLTAVALLLAIFRSKPSPFCILDEVDAALDEANIGRFTAVLREFLDRSQFILITHSKKTMAAADVLYGITMQESGVSKRISVRFEDWPEDGHSPPTSPEPALAQGNGQE
jgi:chromosome segregation protein